MKKFITIVLALVLALSLCAAPVFAAANSMDNFTKSNTYSNQFTDVSGHWAASVIQACYEYGLMNGTSATTFKPTGDLTVAQAIVMAARVHQTYAEGACTLTNGTNGEAWYKPYVDYALANGLITEAAFPDVDAKITRAGMAGIFAKSLPASELPLINVIESVPDVTVDTSFAAEILDLYQAGVLTGSNAYGNFKPYDTITRAEAAAIIARVAVPAERKTINLLKAYSYGDCLTFAMHANAEPYYDEASGTTIYADEIAAVNVQGAKNESYKGLTVQALTLETWTSIFCDALESQGLNYTTPQIGYVNYGDTPAVKMITDYLDENGAHIQFGGFAFIDSHAGEMILILYATEEDTPTMLNAMLKEIRIHGNKAS
ncbi:MAG: S-layer homology domain-containing protein [Clostridiales bacterium]|nr:S-layer homology domain-containing protein [Clostridiales bacterium]